MAVRCGIDLGATFSSISYYVEGYDRVDSIDLAETADGQKAMRSAVYYPADGAPPVVGAGAWKAHHQHPELVLVDTKRLMGTNEALVVNDFLVSPQQVSAEILKALVRDAQSFLGDQVGEVVITVPPHFADAECAATEEAARLAGLSVLALLPDPHAAALAYALDNPEGVLDRHVLVFDLGGVSFDVSLLHVTTVSVGNRKTRINIQTLCNDGDSYLGGVDWHAALVELVRQKAFNEYKQDIYFDPADEPVLMENCERAKRDLSITSQAVINVGADNRTVKVTRVEFEDATSDLLMTTRSILEQVLQEAETRHGISRDNINVLLTGGASQMPMVTAMIANVIGKPPLSHRTPEMLHSVGAALHAHLLQPDGDFKVPSKPVDLEPHPMVKNFHANPLPEAIELKWALPGKRSEFIRIKRSEEGGRKSKPAVIYEGQEASFRDGAVKPGTWYLYQAVAVYEDGESSPQEIRTVALGEVKGLAAVWQTNQVCLSWEKTGADTTFTVLKNAGERPQFRVEDGEIVALNNGTRVLYAGPNESYIDSSDLVEGVVYFYTIITSYTREIHSQGVSVQTAVPKPPSAPQAVTADFIQDKENCTVLVNWQPLPGEQNVEYVLVRTSGSVRPGTPADGNVLKQQQETTFIDRSLHPGESFTYSVFSRQGELTSRTAASTGQVYILAEVTGLSSQTGAKTVEINWQMPVGVKEVSITRTSPQESNAESLQLRQTSPGYLRDENVSNAVAYIYRVRCCYNIAGQETLSPGASITVIPEELPTPANDLDIKVEGLTIIVSWTPPETGSVVVVRSAHPPEYVLHQKLKASEVDRLAGSKVHVEGDRAIDQQPDVDLPVYSIFSVAGQHAVFCGTRSGVLISDPSDLRLSVSSNGIYLRWSWAPGCTSVKILRKEAGYAQGVDDPAAVAVPFSRWEYGAAGDKYFDKIENQSGRFYYTVFSQAASSAGQFYSPGNNPGCQAQIEWRPTMTLSYRIVPVANSAKGGEFLLRWSVIDPSPGFAGFCLVASQDRVPASIDDGVVLHRWTPGVSFLEGDFEETVNLAPVRNRRWSRFFLKLFCTDPAQSHFTLIIHPNTIHHYLEDGSLSVGGDERAKSRQESFRVYESGVPEEVVCPYCFESFPPEEMYFSSYAGDQPVKAKYSPFDRMRRRPIQPPKDSRGRLMTVRLCPHDFSHILPFSAGMQTSLVIGLIGARGSGKSHYIATLIDRLQKQVGGDMQASLLEVTEETASRYRREFYDPLFRSQIVLPFTVGSPPPLIYDLTLDGSLWGEKENRAVTLAFYDTAGENLEEPATARRMVQYLRKASGIIFLVDPLQSTAIRQALPKGIVPPELDSRASPNSITSIVLQLLEDNKVLAAGAQVSIPVAMVMNKVDVLVDAGMIQTNRLWSTERRHIGSYDTLAHDDMDGMMAEYFQRWNPDAYNNIRLHFNRHAFFGASAIGCGPDPVTNRYPFISPWRVEDPLLWLLSELKVIPKRS